MNNDFENEFEMVRNPYIEEVETALEEVRKVKSKVERLITDGNDRMQRTTDRTTLKKLSDALKEQKNNLRVLETSERKLLSLMDKLEKGENVFKEEENKRTDKTGKWWFWGGNDEISELLTEVREQLKTIEESVDRTTGGALIKRKSMKKSLKKSVKKSVKKSLKKTKKSLKK